MYLLIGAGIFILICCVIAWHYANKRAYKDDALRYSKKEDEVDHVLQQRLNIEKIKAQKASKRVKVESSGFSIGSVIGGIILMVITAVVVVNVMLPIIQQINTTSSFSQGEVALWGTVTLIAIAGFAYHSLNVFGLGE